MGAHLGFGGTVEGDTLVCPFHRFAFGADGSCVSDPDGVPLRTRVEPRPRLAPGDQSVGIYRHWARQFYPPGAN
ncbi:Rieske 2Fe-2S domain-containing protein [Kitasatospora sp. NPDC058444]|uniref:Rieske 2Fe-2S domain-containing protein n=1 Tax=Kitasatospora sp. NPDC058444 TaxID=3346504 RepID=UPI003661A89C